MAIRPCHGLSVADLDLTEDVIGRHPPARIAYPPIEQVDVARALHRRLAPNAVVPADVLEDDPRQQAKNRAVLPNIGNQQPVRVGALTDDRHHRLRIQSVPVHPVSLQQRQDLTLTVTEVQPVAEHLTIMAGHAHNLLPEHEPILQARRPPWLSLAATDRATPPPVGAVTFHGRPSVSVDVRICRNEDVRRRVLGHYDGMSSKHGAYVPNDLLGRLVGFRLFSVQLVMDYVQLRFDGPTKDMPVLNCDVLPVVETPTGLIAPGQVGYADALRAFIPGHVVATLEQTGRGLRIEFDKGAIVLHPDIEDVLPGPEIASLNGFEDRRWMCWRPGEVSFEDVV